MNFTIIEFQCKSWFFNIQIVLHVISVVLSQQSTINHC